MGEPGWEAQRRMEEQRPFIEKATKMATEVFPGEIGFELNKTAAKSYISMDSLDATGQPKLENSYTAGDKLVRLKGNFLKSLKKVLPENRFEIAWAGDGWEKVVDISFIWSPRDSLWFNNDRVPLRANVNLGLLYITKTSSNPYKRYRNLPHGEPMPMGTYNNPKPDEILPFYKLVFKPKFDTYHVDRWSMLKKNELELGKKLLIAGLTKLSNNMENINRAEQKINALMKVRQNLPEVLKGQIGEFLVTDPRSQRASFLGPGPTKGRPGNIRKRLENLTPEGRRKIREQRLKEIEERRKQTRGNNRRGGARRTRRNA